VYLKEERAVFERLFRVEYRRQFVFLLSSRAGTGVRLRLAGREYSGSDLKMRELPYFLFRIFA
jgi:hypothetical protein